MGVISGLLREPERLCAGLDAMIEEEKASVHGGPEAETALWLDKLAEVNRKRACYHEMAAVDLIGFDELRARIAELDETRAAAERELSPRSPPGADAPARAGQGILARRLRRNAAGRHRWPGRA